VEAIKGEIVAPPADDGIFHHQRQHHNVMLYVPGKLGEIGFF